MSSFSNSSSVSKYGDPYAILQQRRRRRREEEEEVGKSGCWLYIDHCWKIKGAVAVRPLFVCLSVCLTRLFNLLTTVEVEHKFWSYE